MNLLKFWRRSSWLALVGLVIFAFTFQPVTGQSAGVEPRPPAVSGLLQSTEAYPPQQDQPTVPVDPNTGYPIQTPTAPASQGQPTQPAQPTPGGPTPTASITATLAPDTFKTEDAEMGGSQVTPAVTETPVGSRPTPTVTETIVGFTALSEPEVPNSAPSGFQLDWGLFWFGVSLPLMAACAYVLYLLDRRPELFRRRR